MKKLVIQLEGVDVVERFDVEPIPIHVASVPDSCVTL